MLDLETRLEMAREFFLYREGMTDKEIKKLSEMEQDAITFLRDNGLPTTTELVLNLYDLLSQTYECGKDW